MVQKVIAMSPHGLWHPPGNAQTSFCIVKSSENHQKSKLTEFQGKSAKTLVLPKGSAYSSGLIQPATLHCPRVVHCQTSCCYLQRHACPPSTCLCFFLFTWKLALADRSSGWVAVMLVRFLYFAIVFWPIWVRVILYWTVLSADILGRRDGHI